VPVPEFLAGVLLALYLDCAPAGTSAHPIEITGNYWHNIANGVDNSGMGELDADGGVTTVTLEWGHPYADWVSPHDESLLYDDGNFRCEIPLPYDGLFPRDGWLPYKIPCDHMFSTTAGGGLYQRLPVAALAAQLWNDHATSAGLHWQTTTHTLTPNGPVTRYYTTDPPESFFDRWNVQAQGNYHDVQPTETTGMIPVLDRDYSTDRSASVASVVVDNAGLQNQYRWIANRPELGQLRATMRPAPAGRVARTAPAAGSPTNRKQRRPSIGRDWGSIERLFSGTRLGHDASGVPSNAGATPGSH
jgi:hypothetical protein